MSNTLHLLGGLEQFGGVWQTSETRVADVIKLIDCQIVGFKQYLMDALEAGLEVALVRKDGLEVEDARELFLDNVHQGDMYMSLIPSGSGSGWGKILGALVIGVLTFYTFGGAAPLAGSFLGPGGLALGAQIGYAVAVSLALQGVTELLTKTPKGDKDEKLGSFDGPINTLVAGAPVPILYGELLVGGAPIHVNIGTSKISAFTLPVRQRPDSLGPILNSPAGNPGSPGTLPIMSGTTPGYGNLSPVFMTADELELLNQLVDSLNLDFTAFG